MSFRIFCAAVAGALYDLVDSTDENFDSATFGFYCITDILTQEPREESFSAFWDSWKISVSNHQHDAVRAIYQNTIDYDTPPRFHPLLPNRTVLQGFGWDHAIDLWDYSKDDESKDWELNWQIVNTSDPALWRDDRC
jgi:hypothetical protein